MSVTVERLYSSKTINSFAEYKAIGGGKALEKALSQSPEDSIEMIRQAGLRGRGGAGFPTAIKWKGVRSEPCPTKYIVCNFSEGEPGTFKDRAMTRRNPYQLLEGMAIAAHVIGCQAGYIGIKHTYHREIERLEKAKEEMLAAGALGSIPIYIYPGPDEYLFGEEKGLLEAIEGKPPQPRFIPPFQYGLFTEKGIFSIPGEENPTCVNNAETIVNTVHILRDGVEAFRSLGSEDTPGTSVVTLVGDIQKPGVYEVPMGTNLRDIIYQCGGGPKPGRTIKAIFSGVSAAPLTGDDLDTPFDFGSFKKKGSGLGSAGLIIYDDTVCMVHVLQLFSKFLATESCGQCPSCKYGTDFIYRAISRLEEGGTYEDLETAMNMSHNVTSGTRCFLPQAEQICTRNIVRMFLDDFKAHIGQPCSYERRLAIPKLKDFDEEKGDWIYDPKIMFKTRFGEYDYPDLQPNYHSNREWPQLQEAVALVHFPSGEVNKLDADIHEEEGSLIAAQRLAISTSPADKYLITKKKREEHPEAPPTVHYFVEKF